MRRVRSMLVPVRGQIRRRTKQLPFSAIAGWLPWFEASGLSLDAGLESAKSNFIADGHTGDDWKGLLEQRAREIKAFREAGIRFPDLARAATVQTEPVPTVARPEFLNAIQKEIRASIEASGSRRRWRRLEWLRRVREGLRRAFK